MGGLVSGGSQQTADSAAEMLRQGGNAVDAAVCGALTSCLSEIGFVHLGGGGLAHIYEPHHGRGFVYDFFSRTPGLGSPPRREPLDFYRTSIDYGPTRQEFFLGRGSVAVPGNVAGWCRLQAELGRLSMRRILKPVLALADKGVVLDTFQAATCRLLKSIYTSTPSMRQVFMPGGRFVKPGDRVVVPDLGTTLRGIRAHGERYLTHGLLGEALVRDQTGRGGLVTERDLREFRPRRRDPIRVPYRDYQVLLPPPPSTGGALTALSLTLLSRFDPAGLGWKSADHVRLLAEVMAATSRARAQWDRLLVEAGPTRAIAEFLGRDHVDSAFGPLAASMAERSPSDWVAEPTGPGATTHLSVVDGDGMAVSLSHSAGESAGFVVPETGFIPNNMLGEADLHPLGFHRDPPGHPISTMMTPAILLQGDRVRAVLGSGGSTRIRTVILQIVSNLVDFGMPLKEAVEQPRVHYQDGVLQCEPGYTEATTLEGLGYRVHCWDALSVYFGGAHSVGITSSGVAEGAGDPRRGGTASSA